jgi:hypothetical protein
MIRASLSVGLAIGIVSLASAASAQTAPGKPDGLALGLRLGYALPMGKLAEPTASAMNAGTGGDLSDVVSGMIPIWLDVGYRLNPNVFIGGFFQYGFGIVNKDKNPNCDSCSAHDIAFGADVHYHITPAASFDPWVGAGIGYEILGLKSSTSVPLVGNVDISTSVSGLQFLTLQAGGDFKATPDFAVGPFVNFALGQYSSASATVNSMERSDDIQSKALHEWLTIGARGQFNL